MWVPCGSCSVNVHINRNLCQWRFLNNTPPGDRFRFRGGLGWSLPNGLLLSPNLIVAFLCKGVLRSMQMHKRLWYRMTKQLQQSLKWRISIYPKTKAYDLFYSQVASMSLFYCTYNLKTHGLFVQKGIHQTVIGITKNYVNGDTGDMLMRYRILNLCCVLKQWIICFARSDWLLKTRLMQRSFPVGNYARDGTETPAEHLFFAAGFRMLNFFFHGWDS